MNNSFSRRTLLRGAGATMMLPLMESFAAAGAAVAPPKRLIFLNSGYGPSEAWYPTEAGANFALPKAMNPLSNLRDSFSVVSNLSNLKSATPKSPEF